MPSIGLVDPKWPGHSFEDMAQRMRDEEPDEPLHPMLSTVAGLAFDIAEGGGTYLPLPEREEAWQQLTRTVSDFLAGKWYARTWGLSGTYMHKNGSKGISFTVSFQGAKPHIEVADPNIRKALADVATTLNTKQTAERFLQNLALVLPEKVSVYNLQSVEIREHLS